MRKIVIDPVQPAYHKGKALLTGYRNSLEQLKSIEFFNFESVVKKIDAVNLLASEGWTKADAGRALEAVDFSQDPDELTVRRAASQFSGSELYARQRLQAAQKGIVTRKLKEIEEKNKETSSLRARIEVLSSKAEELAEADKENTNLRARIEVLTSRNKELSKANDQLKKDNKDLKNIVDRIRLQIAIDVKKLMKLEDSEIRQALAKWFSSSQG